jgi:phage-related tail protein
MDPKDKEIADLKAKTAELEATIAEKDRVIEQKTNDVVGARKEYKKLAEMSQGERDELSKAEIELRERTEALEAERQKFAEEQESFRKKDVESRTNAILKRYGAEKNPELAQKIKDNLAKIKDSDKAYTEEEISSVVELAYNMTGEPRTNPVNDAINATGDTSVTTSNGFAETEAGKGLGAALNLNVAKPEAK